MRKIYNKKKGFTLVELIVVIAIIAVLSAVVVPTTLHFVETAHESNDKVLIDISQNLVTYINMSSVTNQGYNITEQANINKFVTILEEDSGTFNSRKYINYIKFIFNSFDSNSYNITVEITGKKEAKNLQTITRQLGAGLGKNDIFFGLDDKDIPLGIIFQLKDGNVISIEVIE